MYQGVVNRWSHRTPILIRSYYKLVAYIKHKSLKMYLYHWFSFNLTGSKTTSYDGFSHGQNMMCRKKVTISSQPTSCNQHFDCKTLVSELVACGISDFDYWNETRWSEFAFKSLITEVFKWNSECLSRNLIINTNYSDSRKYGYPNHLWESVPMKRSDVDHVVPGGQ